MIKSLLQMGEKPIKDARILLSLTEYGLGEEVRNYRRDWNTGKEMSAAGGFSRALLSLGRSGLQDIERKVSRKGDLERKSPLGMYNFINSTNNKFLEPFIQNHVAVVMGALIYGLEEAAVDGTLDMRTVKTIYNMNITSSGIKAWESSLGEVAIAADVLRNGAEKDPSFLFAVFNMELLPPEAKQFIKETLPIKEPLERFSLLKKTAPTAVKAVRNVIRRKYVEDNGITFEEQVTRVLNNIKKFTTPDQ